MSWHEGGKEPPTGWERTVMAFLYTIAVGLITMVLVVPAYNANRDEVGALLQAVADSWGDLTKQAPPVEVPTEPIVLRETTPPPTVIDTEEMAGEVEKGKPQFRPQVEVAEAPTLDPTAELNLKELSKYAVKVGTTVKDGEVVDVWKSMTHDETYYLPHRSA